MKAYLFNPEKFKECIKNSNFTFIDTAICREVIDIVWRSEGKYKIPLDYRRLSVSGMKKNQVEEAIQKASDPKVQLFNITLENEEFFLEIPLLKTQFNLSQIEDEKIVTIDELLNKSIKSDDIILKYIPKGERRIGNLKEVLPTKKYNINGEVLNTKSEYLQSIVKEVYHYQDIDDVFEDILNWLYKNPNRRPSSKSMFNFVINWFQKEQARKSEKSIDSNDIEIDWNSYE